MKAYNHFKEEHRSKILLDEYFASEITQETIVNIKLKYQRALISWSLKYYKHSFDYAALLFEDV